MILSIPSSTKLYTCSTAPRVSASHSTSRISYSVKYGVHSARRRSRWSHLIFRASNPWGMAEMIDDKKSSSTGVYAAAAVVPSSSASDQDEISPPRTFLDARTGQGSFSLNFLVEAGFVLNPHYYCFRFFIRF